MEESDSRTAELLHELEHGPLHRFADWPNPGVPKVAAGLYTVWRKDGLIYAGMSGKGLTAADIEAPDEPKKSRGLRTRLKSHASGLRSGDQFCIYVCDLFIVPHLSEEEQHKVGIGTLSLDAMTKRYIRDNLSYRYVTTTDGTEALDLEYGILDKAFDSFPMPYMNSVANRLEEDYRI